MSGVRWNQNRYLQYNMNQITPEGTSTQNQSSFVLVRKYCYSTGVHSGLETRLHLAIKNQLATDIQNKCCGNKGQQLLNIVVGRRQIDSQSGSRCSLLSIVGPTLVTPGTIEASIDRSSTNRRHNHCLEWQVLEAGIDELGRITFANSVSNFRHISCLEQMSG